MKEEGEKMSKRTDLKESERPGVMLYFDSVRPAINRMSDEQTGALFRAVLDYAQYGEIRDLEAMEGMAFDMLRPGIDRDAERYEETREQRRYAAYSRETKRRGEEPMDLAEWRQSLARANTENTPPSRESTEDNGSSRESTGDNGPSRESTEDTPPSRESTEDTPPSPTTTTTTTRNPASTPASTPASNPAAASIPSAAKTASASSSVWGSSAGAGAGEGSRGEGDKGAKHTSLYRRDEAGQAGQGPANAHTFFPKGRDTENVGQAPQYESPARWEAAGQGLEKTDLEQEALVRELHAAWREAWNAKDLNRAFSLSNRLYALGYRVDRETQQLRRRE